ncbi:serine/threonine-protein phosphatase [bacterium]|nr:serine/threonine-protein phosphatase [bacterium]
MGSQASPSQALPPSKENLRLLSLHKIFPSGFSSIIWFLKVVLCFILIAWAPSRLMTAGVEALKEKYFLSGKENAFAELEQILHRLNRNCQPKQVLQAALEKAVKRLKEGKSLESLSDFLHGQFPKAFSIYVFNEKLERIHAKGIQNDSIIASKKVLKAILEKNYRNVDPPKELERFSEVFTGHPGGITKLADHSNELTPLSGGQSKTWGAWWRVRCPQRTIFLLAFAHSEALSERDLLKKALHNLYKFLPAGYACGAIVPETNETLGNLPKSPYNKNIGINWVEPWLPPRMEIPGFLIAILPGGVKFRLVASVQSDLVQKIPDWVSLVHFGAIALPFVVFLASFRFLFLNPKIQLSIRQLLGGILALGAGVPFAIFLFWGDQFRREEEKNLIEQANYRMETLLNKVDADLPSAFVPLEKRYREMCANYEITGDLKSFSPLHELVSKGIIMGVYISNIEGEIVFAISTPGNDFEKNLQSTIGGFCGGVLSLYKGINPQKSANTVVQIIQSKTLSNSILQNLGRVTTMKVFGGETLHFFQILRSPTTNDSPLLLIISHGNRRFQAMYLKQVLRQFRNLPEVKFAAFPKFSLRGVPAFPSPKILKHPDLVRISEIVTDRETPYRQVSRLGKTEYLFFGMVGRNLSNYVLIAATPTSMISESSRRLNQKLIAVGLVFLFLTVFNGFVFSKHLLWPIRIMEKNLKSIDLRQFENLSLAETGDEMENLTLALTQTAADLKEIHSAKAIQENLVLQKPLILEDFEIEGAMRLASSLGGDYYDAIECPGNRVAIFIGDVAGHGIPAALVVALMKMAGYLLLEDLNATPASVLFRLDRHLYEHGRSLHMTMFLGIIDLKSSTFSYSTAGQAYPIHFSKTGSKLIGQPQYPLGIKKRRPFAFQEIHLDPGDLVVCYTDGLIEPINSNQEMFGYDRFLRVVEELGIKSVREILDGIFSAVDRFSEMNERQDDQTILVVRRRSRGKP